MPLDYLISSVVRCSFARINGRYVAGALNSQRDVDRWVGVYANDIVNTAKTAHNGRRNVEFPKGFPDPYTIQLVDRSKFTGMKARYIGPRFSLEK